MIPLSRGRISESYEVCQLMETSETSYDSIVLRKDIGVIQGLPVDGDQRNIV